jgi:excisionase family DNA binding protein
MVYLINTEKMIIQILEKLENIESLLKDQYKQPLTMEEASIYLRVSKSYLYKMTCQSTLPYYKPNGKKIYFKKAELDEWIFKHRIKSNEDIEKEADEYIRKNPIRYRIRK